jgi:hypothetical protein
VRVCSSSVLRTSRAQPDAFRADLGTSLNSLANRLSDLGRLEESLAPAQEATELYRELAAAEPDAFRPDLAMSLNVLASCLESLSRLDDAVQSDAEAVRVLGPMFLSAPAPFAKLMATIVFGYIRRLKTLNREPQPDMVDLLARILAVLNSDTHRADWAANSLSDSIAFSIFGSNS